VIASDGQIFPAYDFELERRAMDAVHTTTAAPAPLVLAIESDPTIIMRIATMMIEKGMLPADAAMPISNPTAPG
jgi:hypothetical protein